MSRNYSVDLRQRVMDAYDSNMHMDDIIETFRICRSSIYDWINLRKETGSLEPKKDFRNGHSHKIKDMEEFRQFVELHKTKTAVVMHKLWCELKNEEMGIDVVYRALKKLGYSFKKKTLVMLKKTR